MSLGRPWWLAGLLLLVPLVLLHLRQPRAGLREVPSLLLWERLAAPAATADRRLRRPRHPLLLALQALALVAMVLALADPGRTGSAPAPHSVFVLDDSIWMGAGDRMAQARAAVPGWPRSIPATRWRSSPRAERRGWCTPGSGRRRGRARRAATGRRRSRPALGPGGRRRRAGGWGRPGDGRPGAGERAAWTAAAAGQLSELRIGTPFGGPGAVRRIVPLWRRRRRGLCAVRDRSQYRRSRAPSTATPPRSAAARCSPGRSPCRARQRRAGADGVARHPRRAAAGAAAIRWPPTTAPSWTCPAPPARRRRPPSRWSATRSVRCPWRGRFAAVPGVTLRLRTAATYRPADGAASVLVVVDGTLPASGLPRSPAVLLVHPDTVAGARAAGSLPTAPVTGARSRSSVGRRRPLVPEHRGRRRPRLSAAGVDAAGRLERRERRCSPPAMTAPGGSPCWPSTPTARTCRSWRRSRCSRATSSRGRPAGRPPTPKPAYRCESTPPPARPEPRCPGTAAG